MSVEGPIRAAAPWLGALRLAEVVSVDDPERLARVQVKIHGPDWDEAALQWARVVSPFAGNERGGFFIPDVGDEVAVAFIAGDPRAPLVIGGLWSGSAPPPEDISTEVDRWTLTGKAGTRIAILEDGSGRERVEIETPNGHSAKVTDQGGGRIELKAGGAEVKLSPSGVEVTTSGMVTVDAQFFSVSASIVNFDCDMMTVTGFIQCMDVLATSITSPMYSPGAGNCW